MIKDVGVGTLLFVGLIILLAGIVTEFMGMSILAPYLKSTLSYFIAGNTCLLLVLVIDKFQKK